MKKNEKFWAIVAGGTGGHIIPALVFGSWLEKNQGTLTTQYYTGSRDLEKKIFLFHGKNPHCLPLSGSPRGSRLPGALKRYLDMAYTTCCVSVSFFCNPPKGLFLFGGYLCVPFIFAAKIFRIPTLMHEQNALAGRTTRLASRLGIPVCTGWKECLYLEKEKFIFSGIPVRELQHLHVLDAWNKLVPETPCPLGEIILVFGGSLGSSLLEDLAFRLSECEEYASCHFVILSGKTPCCEKIKRENVTFLEPQWDMSPLYSLASVVLARGGGSTLAELLAYGIPGVIIPFSESADGHQEKNAEMFSILGGGSFWKENEPFGTLKKRLNEVLLMKKTKKSLWTEDYTWSSGKARSANRKIFDVMVATYTKGDAPSER